MSMSEKIDAFIETQFGNSETSVFRDLTLNFKKIINQPGAEYDNDNCYYY